jgi:hypothetical protein
MVVGIGPGQGKVLFVIRRIVALTKFYRGGVA